MCDNARSSRTTSVDRRCYSLLPPSPVLFSFLLGHKYLLLWLGSAAIAVGVAVDEEDEVVAGCSRLSEVTVVTLIVASYCWLLVLQVAARACWLWTFSLLQGDYNRLGGRRVELSCCLRKMKLPNSPLLSSLFLLVQRLGSAGFLRVKGCTPPWFIGWGTGESPKEFMTLLGLMPHFYAFNWLLAPLLIWSCCWFELVGFAIGLAASNFEAWDWARVEFSRIEVGSEFESKFWLSWSGGWLELRLS